MTAFVQRRVLPLCFAVLAVGVCRCAGEPELPGVVGLGTHRAALTSVTRLTDFPDVQRYEGSTAPTSLTSLGSFALFFEPAEGRLWRTDGTAAGSTLLLDPGVGLGWDSAPAIAKFAGKAYFVLGDALWETDGAVQGTRRMKDLPPYFGQGLPSGVIVYGGAMYFDYAGQLWKSDGTTAGTGPFLNVMVASRELLQRRVFTELGGKLYFRCTSAATGTELCVTDGTAGGTSVVDLTPGAQGSEPLILGVVGSRIVYSKQVSSAFPTTRSVWSTDGTVGNSAELLPATTEDSVTRSILHQGEFVTLNGVFYFSCQPSEGVFTVCRTDGTPQGTTAIAGLPLARSVVAMGGQVYAGAFSGAIYRTDGTPAGTTVIADAAGEVRDAEGTLVVVGNQLYFQRNTNGAFLWKTNGTAQGTVALGKINSNAQGYYSGNRWFAPTQFWRGTALVGSKLLLAAVGDGIGLELYATDGTTPGSAFVANLTPMSWAPRTSAFRFGDAGYYVVSEYNAGDRVYRSDGTDVGTRLWARYPYSGDIEVFPFQGAVHVYANSSPTTFGLFRLDPSDAGLADAGGVKVHDFGSEAFRGFQPASNGVLMVNIAGLWVYNASGAGRVFPVIEQAWASPAIDGRVYLRGFRPDIGPELFVSDGTDAGTLFVADIYPDAGGSYPADFFKLGQWVLFSANNRVNGNELWRTDGTTQNTGLVKDLWPEGDSNPRGFVQLGDAAVFSAQDAVGAGLFITDGTPSGTSKIAALPGNPSELVAFGSQVFFSCRSAAAGAELWRTDGSANGTAMVADLYPGSGSSNPGQLTLVRPGGPLVFAATTQATGRELFRVDTPTGVPTLAADIGPGPLSSKPYGLVPMADHLQFLADDNRRGRSLFRWDVSPPDTTPPTLTCPADMNAQAEHSAGIAVSYPPPTTADNSGVPPTVTTTHPSGSVFPVGTTRVTLTAQDLSGNSASCSFNVIVALPEGGVDGGGQSDGGTGGGGGGAGGGGGGAGGGGGGAGGDGPAQDAPAARGPCGCASGSGPLAALALLCAFQVRRRRL